MDFDLLELSEKLENSFNRAIVAQAGNNGVDMLMEFNLNYGEAIKYLERTKKVSLSKERSLFLIIEKSIQNIKEDPKRFSEAVNLLDSTLVKKVYSSLQDTLAQIDIEKNKEYCMKNIKTIADMAKKTNLYSVILPGIKSFLVVGAITLAGLQSTAVNAEAAGFSSPNIVYLESGVIRGVKNLEINDARMETGVGAVIGGVAGSFFGGGNSARAVGIGVGAVAGGFAGNAMARPESGQELKIALNSVENGYRKIYTFVAKGAQFQVGDCVQLKIDKSSNNVLEAHPSQCGFDRSAGERNNQNTISQFNNQGPIRDMYIR